MTYRYHPPTVDSLDIEPSDDGLGVRVGIFNTTDSGTYASIEVMNRDIEEVITALRLAAKAPQVFTPNLETYNGKEWVAAEAPQTYIVKGINGEEWVGTATSIAHAASIARSAKPHMPITSVNVRQ